jgi:hypothetical protein
VKAGTGSKGDLTKKRGRAYYLREVSKKRWADKKPRNGPRHWTTIEPTDRTTKQQPLPGQRSQYGMFDGQVTGVCWPVESLSREPRVGCQ